MRTEGFAGILETYAAAALARGLLSADRKGGQA